METKFRKDLIPAARVTSTDTRQTRFTTPKTTASRETKFKKDDIVYERVNPSRKLVVQHFTDGLYYCRLPENQQRSFVYQERELKAHEVQQGVQGLIL